MKINGKLVCTLVSFWALSIHHSTFLAMSRANRKMAQNTWRGILRSYDTTAKQLRELLQAGAVVDTQDHLGKTMLMTCVSYRRRETTDIVRILLAAGADVDKTNLAGATAIMYLLIHHNTRGILAMMLQAGANVNIKDDNGNTALHLAACRSSARTIQMLINAGADREIRNKNDQTAEDFARGLYDCGYTNKPTDRTRMVAILTQKTKLP